MGQRRDFMNMKPKEREWIKELERRLERAHKALVLAKLDKARAEVALTEARGRGVHNDTTPQDVGVSAP